ncbi:hypothetical protein Q8A67_007064 [Cirrhinus molitorella]|uniref:Uncharacterized protein n=1 Tax=Cirrhinus molitorella TaxID=172907 RepID=A0AA88PVE6_9TELE|nr:hypothetical protein Q8A67_007064 [Cirrhinus molitorella]
MLVDAMSLETVVYTARGVCAAVGGVKDASISGATIARVAVMVIERHGGVESTRLQAADRRDSERLPSPYPSTAPPSLQPQPPLQPDRPLIMHGELKRISPAGL